MPGCSIHILALASSNGPRAKDQEDLIEALLRRDTAAAADLRPASWSVADSLTDQVYAIADETSKRKRRKKDDPTLFGMWNALVTRIIATSSEKFRNVMCQAALHKEPPLGANMKSGTRKQYANGPMLRGSALPVWAACSRSWERSTLRCSRTPPRAPTKLDACSRATTCILQTENRPGSSTRRSLRRRLRC